MKKLFTLLAATSFAATAFAGGVPSYVRPYTPISQIAADEYLPNTMVLNVKPEFRAQCSPERIDIPAVNDFLLMIGAVEVKKVFPLHKAPETKYNAFGMEMVDLSLIYMVKYNGALSLEKAIGKMNALGYFEYVEPYYIPKLTYIPTDPGATNSTSYYLYKIAAAGNGTTGWDIGQGNANVSIGITDTGTELNHTDLTNKIAYNAADPINGNDDDNDGYIDNYRGWDVADNDNNPTWASNAHGVHVGGCAAAQINNGSGSAGSGFNCTFLPVKISNSSGQLIASYQGITYAADHGCKVINCSWGGTGGGSFGQQVIDYATINMDALVVAAAGNNNLDEAFYPAAFDKVLSVGSTGSNDAKSNFSNYNYTVDVCAPGSNIYSCWSGNSYAPSSGTSMASPVCAGAAGVVRAYFPNYNALQAGERLKQTADNIYNAPSSNAQYANKLGTGRINLYRALTDPSAPSLDFINRVFADNNDNAFVANDTIRITGDFINYLANATNVNATLTVVTAGGFVTLLDGTTSIGAINTLATASNGGDPFTVRVNPSAPVNQQITFQLNITDGSYSVNKFFSVIVNVDYINITVNDVWTTITSKGLIGYNMDQQMQGLGFDYQQNGSLLYEASFMVGTSATKVSDRARGTTGGDNDFSSVMNVREVVPAVVSDFDVEGRFRDNVSPSPLPVTVGHKAWAWSQAPHSKYVIVQYTIVNTGTTTMNSLFAGIFADWDIDATTYGQNKADFDATNNMGYVYYSGSGGKYCGIKLLTNNAPVVHYAIDNVTGGAGGIDIYGDYTTSEKYTSLSTNRNQAGVAGNGADVCDVVSSGPFTIAAGDSVTVAFALIAGDNLTDLQTSALDAQVMYDNNSPLNVTPIASLNDAFLQLFPNPANNTATINYAVAEQGNVDIRLFDAAGREVLNVASGSRTPGNYTTTIDVATLPNGIYILKMVNGAVIHNRKVLISH